MLDCILQLLENYTKPGVHPPKQKEQIMELLWILVGLFGALVVWNSFALLDVDKGAEVYQSAQHWFTYHPRGFKKSLEPSERARLKKVPRIRVAWFLDIVFWLWPIWRIKIFNTSGDGLEIRATDVFTNGTEKNPRTELALEAIISPRVATIRHILNAFGIPRWRNLSAPCTVKDKTGYEYQSNRLIELMHRKVQGNARDSIRRAAGLFVWDQNHERGLREPEIVHDRRTLELVTLYELGARESFMGQARLLVQPDELVKLNEAEFIAELMKPTFDVETFFGKGVIAVDANYPGLDMSAEAERASDAKKAVNAQFVAQQKARGERLTGFAQAEVIREQGHARSEE